jgi:hypothetical protein
MHDVFIVTSEDWGGGHILRGLRRRPRRRAPNTPGKLCRRARRGGSPMKPSRLVTSGGVRRHTLRGLRKITKTALAGGQPHSRSPAPGV